jgi:hypothetical protein
VPQRFFETTQWLSIGDDFYPGDPTTINTYFLSEPARGAPSGVWVNLDRASR